MISILTIQTATGTYGEYAAVSVYPSLANLYLPSSDTAYGLLLFLVVLNVAAVGCIKLDWPINTSKSKTQYLKVDNTPHCLYSLLFYRSALHPLQHTDSVT